MSSTSNKSFLASLPRDHGAGVTLLAVGVLAAAGALSQRKAGSENQTRLDGKLREKINAQMRAKGLDGNGRFRKPDHGYMKAVEIMQDHGVELDEVVSSFQFTARPSGVVKARIAFTNKADLFSPMPISNSMLYLQYTELRKDMFEVVAYLS